MSAYIRIWKDLDLNLVSKQLLIIGQLTGDCSNCKAVGLDYLKVKSCPQCATIFKFIATRQNEGKFSGQLLNRLKTERPDLGCIDYSDFKQAIERNRAREFFK